MSPQHANCEHKILVSFLEITDGDQKIQCAAPVVLRPPPGLSHLDHARDLLAESGLNSTADLRALPGLPAGRWIVRVHAQPLPDSPDGCDPLLSAAILGLAGPSFYSPARPVVWTQDRLSRAITLHRLPGFYED
jgi:hypothetical protein